MLRNICETMPLVRQCTQAWRLSPMDRTERTQSEGQLAYATQLRFREQAGLGRGGMHTHRSTCLLIAGEYAPVSTTGISNRLNEQRDNEAGRWRL